MNNHRLLAGLCMSILLSESACSFAGGPLSLEQIFEYAEANSVQLRQYVSAEDEARKDISVAKSNRLPDINASLALSYLGDGFTTERNFSDYQRADIPHLGNTLSVNINQPLYAGGSIKTGIELAELKSTASHFETEFQRDNLRFRLTGYYLDIYKHDNLRVVVENNISTARMVLDEMKLRYNQGIALQNDITRYELLVSNLELQLVKINNTIDILRNNLIVTAGLPADVKIIPDSTLLSRSLPVNSEAWWQNEATVNAPSISLAHTGVEISRKYETLAKSERLPKIGLNAAWSLDGPILVEVPPIQRNLSYWYVGVGVSYNLSSLFKTNKSIAKSRAATIAAADRYNSAAENIALAVRSDYVRYLEAYEELKTMQKSVELAERNYKITSNRYSADMALITDMIDAANAKLDAEQQLVNSRVNIIYYYYKLLFTTGKI